MKTFFVVMAGGPGSRLWPESRRAFPKPFLPLLPDGRSLFRATLDRVKAISEDGVIVVTGRPFEEHVRAAAPEIAPERILLEPEGRDTAPCVAWAALEALRADEDAALVVMPSDHQIYPDEKFQTRIQAALRLVEENPAALVTLGVTPTSPSTAYGYIEKGAAAGSSSLGAYRVATFHEKPDVETAETYLRSGNFLWNAGVFVWKARTFLNLLAEYEPDFKAPLEKARERINAARAENRNPSDDPAFIRAFREMKRISVDKAVLERAKEILTLQVDFFWNDLGSFRALEASEREASGCADANFSANALILAENARGNYVRTRAENSKRKLVVLIDVDDLLVVETDDALLIAKKNDGQALKDAVERIRKEGLEEYL